MTWTLHCLSGTLLSSDQRDQKLVMYLQRMMMMCGSRLLGRPSLVYTHHWLHPDLFLAQLEQACWTGLPDC